MMKKYLYLFLHVKHGIKLLQKFQVSRMMMFLQTMILIKEEDFQDMKLLGKIIIKHYNIF